jgi:hypothetical protein
MKLRLLFTFIAIFIAGHLFAQDCEAYVPTKMNQKLTYKTLDKKGNVQSYYTNQLIFKNNIDGGVEFGIHSIQMDDKKKMLSEDTMTFYCKDNTFYMDMSSFLNEEAMGGEGVEMEMTFSEMGYPKSLNPGTTLNDAWVEAKIVAGIPMVFRTDITNRKVLAIEDVTTEAGTFNAIKISESISSKMGFMTVKMTTTSWMKMNIGSIKSETYDSKGNLVSTSELVSIE